MKITDEAAEAAEAVLLGYTGGCTCHEGYSGRNLIDPECSYHDVPPEVAREILEAAAPFMRQAFFLEMNLRAVQDELRATPIYPRGNIEDKRP